MTNARRWLAIDADLFSKPFTDALYARFGPAGVCTWLAFLCACKRSRIPGRITIRSEGDGLVQLGIDGWELVDNDGKTWTLDDFWTFTGRKKQTQRTHRGRQMNVVSTHWERWQDTAATEAERERKRRWWAENRGESSARPPLDLALALASDKAFDLDSDKKPPTPNPSSQRQTPNPNTNGAPPGGRPIATWQPDPEPTEPLVGPGATANLRRPGPPE